jgi:hypothetical protein
VSDRSRIANRHRAGRISAPQQSSAALPVSNPTPDTAPRTVPPTPANAPTVSQIDSVSAALNEAAGSPSALTPAPATSPDFTDPEGTSDFKPGYGTVLLIPLALLAIFAAWKLSK